MHTAPSKRRETWTLREPVERAGLSAQVCGSRGTPTKRRPSSSYWPGSGIDGASSIGSVPDWVFGKAITSRMFVCCGQKGGPAIDAERDPAVRRRAVLEGVEDGPELLVHRLERVALQPERALEQVAPMDPDRAAAQLPAVERQVVLERPGVPRRVVG